MALAIFWDFAREWDQFQDIPHLNFSLTPYAQGEIQEQEIQWILPHKLKMKFLVRQSHKNYTDL